MSTPVRFAEPPRESQARGAAAGRGHRLTV
eukprot:SAG31_NODE_1004_length_10437_cov_2.754208_12_plen_29_part_01